MEFFLLGPVEARSSDRPVQLGRRRERLLLGVLLLDAGRPISIDRLLDLLWEDDPTPAARASLHSHIARLRSVLQGHGIAIATRGGGYVADVDPAAVDVHRFRRQVQRAREMADPDRRAGLLRHALALWRGPLLADVADDRLRDRIGADLVELRIAAIEARAESDLSCGRHAQVVLDLAGPVAAEPTRERLTGLLMLALFRSGRQADALAAYERIRHTLDEELGLVPAADLSTLREQILRGDPALDAPVAADPPEHRRRFLPRDVPDFTGRTAALHQLDMLAQSRLAAPAIVITAIAGTAGVGKTALAVHWGHRIAGRFPDGQLYVDLRGYDPRRPASPIDALAGLLRSLGVAAERVPTDQDEAAALFRSMLADRRVLILLDNARSASQVRPLLPASPTCLVVITSRDALNGLLARDGARRLELDVMTPAESVSLITRIAGERRAIADEQALLELAELCGHLPVALRIAAASLADRPITTVGQLVSELRQRGRMAGLELSDDPASSVRATFGYSLAALPEAVQRVFALLGLTAGGQFGAEAVAALCDIRVERAAQHLCQLAEAHLIQEIAPDRYAMHDLLREYASDVLTATTDPGQVRAAIETLHAWYLGGCDAAAELLYKQMVRLPLDGVAADRRPAFDSPSAALAWLDVEWTNLVAWFHAMAPHSPRLAWLLADALRGYFWLSRLNVEWLDIATAALSLAQSAGDLAAEAAAQLSLGNAYLNQNALGRAVDHYLAAVETSLAAGWRAGEASALNNLATLHWLRGELDAAELRLRQALQLNRSIGRRLGEARQLSQLSQLAVERGRLTEALELAEQALEIETAHDSLAGQVKDTIAVAVRRHLLGDSAAAQTLLIGALTQVRVMGESRGEVDVLGWLGLVLADLGRSEEAAGYAGAALALAQQVGDPHSIAPVLSVLALIEHRRGHLDEAEAHCLQALQLADAAADRYPRAMALVELGRVQLARGQLPEALATATEGCSIAQAVGYRLIEADALTVIARVNAALGRRSDGERSAREGLAIYREAPCPIGVARALEALAATTSVDAELHRAEANKILAGLGIADAAIL